MRRSDVEEFKAVAWTGAAVLAYGAEAAMLGVCCGAFAVLAMLCSVGCWATQRARRRTGE